MELSDGRYSTDSGTTQLSELLAFTCIDIDEAIHVAYAEPLNAVLRLHLPLCAETTRTISDSLDKRQGKLTW